MIGFALAPLAPMPSVGAEGTFNKGALLFDAKTLNAVVGARGFPVTPAPGPRGDQTGPRLASFSVLEVGAQDSKGARLVLGPKARDILGKGTLIVRVSARGFDNNPATRMALGIVREGNLQWGQANVSPTGAAIEFSFPASDKPATALAIWPATEGQGRGVELQSIAVFRGYNEATP